jgi:glycerophosphoryl diester phosphodiesterase
VNRWLRPQTPLAIAHRGHSLKLPEQTMTAFRAAIELGAEMIEADVRATRDGQLVMLHDATLDRTSDGRGPVDELGWDEIAALDAGSWFAPEFAGQRVPLLDELLDYGDAERIALCLEVKGETPAARLEIALEVARRIETRGALDRYVLSSFDHDCLIAATASTPGLATAPDRLPERGQLDPRLLVEQARRIGAPIMQHHHADLDSSTISALHAAGVALWAWPTTAPTDIEAARDLGSDGLMGDDVEAICEALRSRP